MMNTLHNGLMASCFAYHVGGGRELFSKIKINVIEGVKAGLLSAPLVFNSPGGHQMLHELGLRVAFADALDYARDLEHQPSMGFGTFRVFAPFYLSQYFGDNKEGFEQAMKLFSVSLCIPADNQDGPDFPGNYSIACHAAGRQEEDMEANPNLGCC